MSELHARISESFSRQGLMRMLQAELTRVEVGHVDIRIPYAESLSQQNGFLHAAITTAIADSACGYAALTTMPTGADVLSVEFKVNLLAPAAGEAFTARARVIRAGRTLVVVAADVFAHRAGDDDKQVATMLATMIRLVNDE